MATICPGVDALTVDKLLLLFFIESFFTPAVVSADKLLLPFFIAPFFTPAVVPVVVPVGSSWQEPRVSDELVGVSNSPISEI